MELLTFQVQVLGPVDTLTRGRGVYFQCVCVAVVSGDGHIVPLVVIQRSLTFPLDEIGPISQVENIVDVSAGERIWYQVFLSSIQTFILVCVSQQRKLTD